MQPTAGDLVKLVALACSKTSFLLPPHQQLAVLLNDDCCVLVSTANSNLVRRTDLHFVNHLHFLRRHIFLSIAQLPRSVLSPSQYSLLGRDYRVVVPARDAKDIHFTG